MTLYMLFVGLGILIFTSVAYADGLVPAFRIADVGLHVAFLASLSVFLATFIVFHPNRFLRTQASRVDRTSAWKARMFIVVLMFFVSGVAIVVAATREPGDAPSCNGQCGAGDEPITVEASIISRNASPAVVVTAESARAQAAAGQRLFEGLGCGGCHRADGTGIGPVLTGLFGRPVSELACGYETVDEAYLREAILNPSVTVAIGFLPVMPTFAGQLTEEDLQALVAYLKSLT